MKGMAHSGGAAVGGSRGDALSTDRIELFDLDELMKKVHEKRKENSLLKQHLSELEHYVATTLAALRCTDARQLDDLLRQLIPHPIMMKEQSVSTQYCASLNRWASSDDRVAIHKMLGTEIVRVKKDSFIANVHCYEDNYPHLPPKLLVIEKIPDSKMFKLKPKQILLYIDCTAELKNLMLRSPEEVMVKCFQEIQSLLFDMVDRDNIYQNLRTKALVKQTLTCSMSRRMISFMLPRQKNAFRTFLRESSSAAVKGIRPLNRVGESNTVTSIVQKYFTVLLFVDLSKESGWRVDIMCEDDAGFEDIPGYLHEAMTAFTVEVSQGSVTDAVSRLLRKVEQLLQVPDIDDYDTSGSSDDNVFGALF